MGAIFITSSRIKKKFFSTNDPSYGYAAATLDLTATFSGESSGILVGGNWDEHKIVEINCN